MSPCPLIPLSPCPLFPCPLVVPGRNFYPYFWTRILVLVFVPKLVLSWLSAHKLVKTRISKAVVDRLGIVTMNFRGVIVNLVYYFLLVFSSTGTLWAADRERRVQLGQMAAVLFVARGWFEETLVV